MCRPIGKLFMLIVETLPSTLILYLWAVLIWQWYKQLCLSEKCLKWQRRSKVPPNARCRELHHIIPEVSRPRMGSAMKFLSATHRKEISFWTPLWLEMKHEFFTTLLKPSNIYCNDKKKSWRGSKGRRQTSMTRGYRSWFQDLIVWTMPATMFKNKVVYRQFIHSVAFVN
jgi:hypothetical protein